jgi:4-diphosphocytidyl-2-C-methyl-D-erythritol kinase
VTRVTISAPAKLNLRLLVGPRGPDGYHPLRTLMVVFDGLADTVTVAAAEARSLSCPGIEGPQNLAWRALDELEAEAGQPLPTEVVIDKRIPAQAGLGGGSSDAAAVLVGADRAHGLGLGAARLERVAARVGSDVPFFVRGGAQWAEGRGERLRPASVPPFAALLAKPAAGLSTAAVYRAFDRLPPPSPPSPSQPPHRGGPGVVAGSINDPARDEVVAPSRNDPYRDEVVARSGNDPYRDEVVARSGNDPYRDEVVARSGNDPYWEEVVARSRNDLWGAALALAPSLGATARALAAAGADRVLLCGSGSCLAGLFRDRARADEGAARMATAGFRAVVTGPAAPRVPVSG